VHLPACFSTRRTNNDFCEASRIVGRRVSRQCTRALGVPRAEISSICRDTANNGRSSCTLLPLVLLLLLLRPSRSFSTRPIDTASSDRIAYKESPSPYPYLIRKRYGNESFQIGDWSGISDCKTRYRPETVDSILDFRRDSAAVSKNITNNLRVSDEDCFEIITVPFQSRGLDGDSSRSAVPLCGTAKRPASLPPPPTRRGDNYIDILPPRTFYSASALHGRVNARGHGNISSKKRSQPCVG